MGSVQFMKQEENVDISRFARVLAERFKDWTDVHVVQRVLPNEYHRYDSLPGTVFPTNWYYLKADVRRLELKASLDKIGQPAMVLRKNQKHVFGCMSIARGTFHPTGSFAEGQFASQEYWDAVTDAVKEQVVLVPEIILDDKLRLYIIAPNMDNIVGRFNRIWQANDHGYQHTLGKAFCNKN